MILMRFERFSVIAVPPLALALAVTGCSSPDEAADGSNAVDVMTEVYAFTWIAEEIGGDRVSVTQLIPTGADVHQYEVSPRQVDDMSDADLVVLTSGAAPAVDDAVVETAPAHVVDATDHIQLLAAVTDQDEHPAGEHSEEDEHDHGNFDPHTWLAIDQLPSVVDAVAESLTEIDPDGAESYASNAEALGADLADLDEAYANGLESCERDTIVVTHPAFGYIATAYGFHQMGISSFDEDTEPSPARLTEVSDIAAETGATTIFMANTSNPKVADVLATDLGLETAVLSTITDAGDGDDYLSLAEDNLATLQGGLGCQ